MTTGDIDVGRIDAFDAASMDIRNIADAFAGPMQEAGNNSASPAAAGRMPEGHDFMSKERQARDLLAQYMTKTKNGLSGYGTAVNALGQEHDGLAQLNNRQMQTLLRPQEGPMPTDPAFDWRRALADQNAARGGN